MPAPKYIELRIGLDEDERVHTAARLLAIEVSEMIGLLYIVLLKVYRRIRDEGADPAQLFGSARARDVRVTSRVTHLVDVWGNKSGLAVALETVGILTDTGFNDFDSLCKTRFPDRKSGAKRARAYRERQRTERLSGLEKTETVTRDAEERTGECPSPPHTPPLPLLNDILSSNSIYKSKSRAKPVGEKKPASPPPGCLGKSGGIFYDPQKVCFVGITEKDLARWREAYPACDVAGFLKRLAIWVNANPAKGLKINYRRTITNNLSRLQQRGGDKSSESSLVEPHPGKYTNLSLFSEGPE